MKLVIRAFVVVLALTGAVASTRTSVASAKTIVASSSLRALPIPSCPPDGSNNNCNIGAMSGK